MDAEAFLEQWFGPPGGPVGLSSRWWEKDPDFDQLLRDRFLALHADVVSGKHDDWKTKPRSCCAYVVVIDQLSRNMFRGKPEAFAYDTLAQVAVLAGLHHGLDRELDARQRLFFYLPLLHAEDRQLQDRAIIEFATLAAALPEAERGPVLTQVVMAARHRNVIVRFGRFPHRNSIVGRESTSAEIAFLQEPHSSF